jgi:2-dehydro-3-deoxygluconokinase
MPDLLSLGECMVELYSEQPIEEADTFTRSLAGDSLNILVAAQRLGTSTGYITRLGDDPFAAYLLGAWRSEGIDTSRVRVVAGFNAVHFVALMPDGDREFVYYRKGSAPSTLSPEDLDSEYIGAAKLQHLSGIAQAISSSARDTVLSAARIARQRGVAVSYDPNYRHQLWSHEEAREAMEEVLPYVDFLLPSAPADARALLDTDDPHAVVEHYRGKGVPVVAVTHGEKGVVVGAADGVFEVPAFRPEGAIDTTATGDAFNGGFLHGVLSGMTVEDAARLGVVTAGLKLRGRGALAGMPFRDEVFATFEQWGQA